MPDPPPPLPLPLLVIGGGAAGFFGAITAAEHGVENIVILESTREVLTKVRISGGGRCNVTHACHDPKELVSSYPRGHKNLLGPFHRWQSADTVQWFEDHGIPLKTEDDGRMFPVTDDSETIVRTLQQAAKEFGIRWHLRTRVTQITREEDGTFTVVTEPGAVFHAQRILIATGGIRTKEARLPVTALEQLTTDPVPSLFTFKVDDERIADLPGISVPDATARAAGMETSGPILVTHWGLSGPAILKLSAWAARELAAGNYRFTLTVNWTGRLSADAVARLFENERAAHGTRQLRKRSLVAGIPVRLWQNLCAAAGIADTQTWAQLSRQDSQALAQQLTASEFAVTGKSLNKDEFVTCGGVPLDEVNLKTMESRRTPGVYYAGEVLDVDGITGGFNFQAAWTTGRIAGEAVANV